MDRLGQVLSDLAARLGTTVDRLWPMLVKQTIVDWWMGMATALFAVIVGVTILLLLARWLRKTEQDFDDSLQGIIFSIAGSFSTLGGLIGIAVMIAQMSAILLPEAATVTRLLEALGGKK